MRGSLVLLYNACCNRRFNICEGSLVLLCNACCNRRFNICEVHSYCFATLVVTTASTYARFTRMLYKACCKPWFNICELNTVSQHMWFYWILVKSRCSKIPFCVFLVNFEKNPIFIQKTLTQIFRKNPILSRSHFIVRPLYIEPVT